MRRASVLGVLAALSAVGVAACGGGSSTTFSVASQVYNPNTDDSITSNNGVATIQYSIDLATSGKIIPSKATAKCLADYVAKNGVNTIGDALNPKNRRVLVKAGATCGVR